MSVTESGIITELIKKRIKIKVEIIEESIERYLTYISLKEHLPNYQKLRDEGLLLVEVGSNSSEVLIYKKNRLVRNNEIHTGTLVLKDLIHTIKRESLHVPQILEDYIYAATENLQNYLKRKKIRHFVILGTDIKRVYDIFGDLDEGFSKVRFEEIVNGLYKQSRQLKQALESEMLDYYETLSAMTIFEQFFKHTEAEMVYVPSINLRDGILMTLIEDVHAYERDKIYTKDILKAAKQIAKRHHSTMNHINKVDKMVVKIFDAYKEEENFSDFDLLLVRLACILHETGKFTRQFNYHDATYQSIQHASLLGVTQHMLRESAQIAAHFFYFTQDDIKTASSNYRLNIKNVKLGLILALADSLDKAKKSNINLVQVKLDENELKLFVSSETDYFFEKWAVRALAEYFSEINAHRLTIKDIKNEKL